MTLAFITPLFKSKEQKNKEIQLKTEKTCYVYAGAVVVFLATSNLLFSGSGARFMCNVLALGILTKVLEEKGRERRPGLNYLNSILTSSNNHSLTDEQKDEFEAGNIYSNIINGGAYLFDKCTKF